MRLQAVWCHRPDQDPPQLTTKAGTTPVTIDIGEGEDNLAAIRDKINGANAGVTATIINPIRARKPLFKIPVIADLPINTL